MLPDLDQLRKNYESYDDNKLIRIATEEAEGLRPEAVDLLKQIIAERGLSIDIIKSVDAQLKPLNSFDLGKYADILRAQPCPICGATDQKLNGGIAATVMSFVILTNYRKEFKIACPNCLDRKNGNAILTSAVLGWWGLPWGIIRTPQAIINNLKMKKKHHLPEANDLMLAFTAQNIGRIEANKNNPEGLQNIISHIR